MAMIGKMIFASGGAVADTEGHAGVVYADDVEEAGDHLDLGEEIRGGST